MGTQARLRESSNCTCGAAPEDATVRAIQGRCGGGRRLCQTFNAEARGSRIMRRGEERVRNTLQLLSFHLVHVEDYLPHRSNLSAGGAITQTQTAGPTGSPLDNAGPIPVELQRNPFPGDSTPWGLQMAVIDRDRTRERLVWASAALVSWLVTGVLLLRALNIL